MKIAVDARELQGRRTGVGRYVHEVLRSIAGSPRGHAHEFVLCATAPINLTAYEGLRVATAVAPGGGTTWEQLTLPQLLRRERPDVLLAPGYTAPLWTTVPTVLVIHDVSFAAHPEWFSWREGARRRTLTRLAARRAARVVTVSRFSKHEIEACLGVEPQQIAVIPNGITRLETSAVPPTGDATVLFVGSVFNRRNVPALIQAVGLLASRGAPVRLDIVGDNRTNPHINLAACAEEALIADRVNIRSYVADDVLTECYGRARAFAFLSDYEGFGLTPLEALSAGVPIVVLDRPATREVYGDAAVFVSEPEPGAIAEGLERALFSEQERGRVLEAAHEVLRRYSWTSTALQLLDLLEATAGNQSSHR